MYYFYLGDMQLPVPPSSMTLTVNNKNETVNLINEGEVNILKTPGLSEISFEPLIPNIYYPFADYGENFLQSALSRYTGSLTSGIKSQSYTDYFEQLKVSQKPVRFIVSRMKGMLDFLHSTNMLVTIEDYSIYEAHEEGYDIKVPLRLKQYRPYATKELTVTENENGEKVATYQETRIAEKEIPQAYETPSQMTVWEACKRISGGSLDWRTVASNNKILNPNEVAKNTKLIFNN